uniref:FERM, ARHGEF and pleckstrin domain-containing protein 1 n=1 Tax=Neogobius melanostomus TaxID=47308 RepID=A0A8C6SQA7_9GOBI
TLLAESTLEQKASGKMLLDLVCSHMNLIEADYFGLEYQNHQKMMVGPKNTILRFAVKFFPLITYLFALQVKQDLSCGRLTCNDTSAALLVSHIIQCKPVFSTVDQSTSKSDIFLLTHRQTALSTIGLSFTGVARRLEMYGIRVHAAKDREGTRLSLAVAHTGVLVFQGQNKINAFNWSKVRKLSFKRKRFLIKLRPDLNSSYQDTLEFLMASRNCCKVFWKICVEYHAFFRLFEEPKPKPKPVLFSRGSSFRFSGRTQKQVIDYRFPTDRAYFIAKELLTTERTYVKDLEVITVSFQSALAKDEATPDSLKTTLSSTFEPLHRFHTGFLREVEQRLALWEGRSNAHIKGDYQRIGDVMLKNLHALKPFTANLHKQSEILVELEKAWRGSRRLETLCRDFELQKVCYIPLNVFILRPLHRLIHYKQILERLCKHYPATHVDFRDCRAALADVSEVVDQLQTSVIKMENFQKLLELKKDLVGVDNLVVPGRVRIKSVLLLDKQFFSDVILYTSRGMTSSNQFKVHGQLPLRGMTIRESEDEWGVPHAFTLVGQQQSVVVAASCLSEMERWIEDIKMAVETVKSSNGPSTDLLMSDLNDNKCPEDSAEAESEDDMSAPQTSSERPTSHRGNTMVHVCWHRNTSVSMMDYSIAVENQLSGNLLRKFKNSNGWQKLWVVFTNFSLFFYKSHQDDYPLASLPLLGYSVTIPAESENIHKDYVFKLHFKSHVYYFRSESEYTFERYLQKPHNCLIAFYLTRLNLSLLNVGGWR